MKHKIIITETLDQACADWLAQRANVVWCSHEDTVSFEREIKDADALVVRTYTKVDQRLLDQAPKLKIVGRAGVGLDNIDIPACRARKVHVVHTPDANSQAVVEYVMGLILDDLRPRYTLPGAIPNEEFHQLRKDMVGKQFDQLTLGIIGFGRIGKKLGQVAHALGVKILVNDLMPESHILKFIDYSDKIEVVGLPELLGRSDIVSIHVDGRPENKHIINADTLSELNPSALFINSARGFLVDAPSLARWATENKDNGARVILDVHDPEPPTIGYPLIGLDNVRLLPHLASRTRQALANMSWVVEDVYNVLEGEFPRFPAPQ